MSSTPPTGGRLLVEPLEARIAPTGLTAISNNPAFAGSTDPYYVTYNTAPSSTHLGFVPAATYLGASAPANLYAIKLTGDGTVNSSGLSNGDALLVFNSVTGFNPTNPFLQATNKTLIAFFQDKNGDGQVQTNELVGLSLTKQSSVNVNGNVNGDIVTNLSKDGSTINLTSVNKPGFSIGAMTISGNVTGNILAGGNINNVNIQGNANNILAGTATNGVAYNFTGNAGGVTGTIAEGAFPAAKPGASITGLTVTSLTPGTTIHAGDGGLGAVGGDIFTLAVLGDTAAFNVVAGNGGVGSGTVKGGAGGDISAVTLVGVAGTTNNALINLHAGNGGEDDAFKGGTGGSVFGLAASFNLGFDTTTNTGTASADLLTQNILVHAGDGGAGLKGGRGGDVTGSQIFSAAPDDGVVTSGVANAEIQVIAGHGGLPTTAGQGHGGKGGNISQVFAEDQDTNADGATSTVLVQGGDGGAGKDGGTVSGVSVLGGQLIVSAGNGGDGIATGGPGGSLETIDILNLPNLFTHQLTLNAGSGGASSAGTSGAGGEINTVSMLDSDLNLLAINTGTHANGGVSDTGIGGAGGAVLNVQLTDSDAGGQFATVAVRSGAGGDGHLGGGAGGSIGDGTNPFQMFGLNFSYSVTAGAGGTVLAGGSGKGGAGGGLDTVGISSVPTITPVDVGTTVADALNVPGTDYTKLTGTATAGMGGAGTSRGGAGGSLAAVDLQADDNVTLTAGTGGTGGTRAGGAGGSVSASAGVSLGGAVAIVAGNAASGVLAASGGGISGAIASAQTNITMTAGFGTSGGAGGSIATSGTTANPLYVDPTFTPSLTELDQTVSNFGNVTITAGAGSSGTDKTGLGVAGAGGSVTNFTGSIGLGGAGDFSNANTATTSITAGAGGGGSGQTASGAGGIVDQLKLTGNSLTDFFGAQIVTVDGGAAGVATAATTGAAGGGVSNATIYNLDVGTAVQHLAAGDGASGTQHGGAGGTITEVHVGRPGDTVADIGIRDGVAFGYAVGSAGGLFAGVGGTGAKSTGLNGDVTNITANAISSIVAGKTSTIHLVHLVDGIDLEGNTVAAANADGSFTNFDTANVVGSVYNNGAGSTGAGASTFKSGDGLIAATTITNNRNFFPEAALTYDPNNPGVLEFFDYQEPNTNTPVVTTTIPVTYSL